MMQNYRLRQRKNDGFVLALALIALVGLSFFIATGISTTTTSVKVGGNYTRSIESFNLAETALAKSRPILEANDFDTLLISYAQPGTKIVPTTSFNRGTYHAYIEDNDDGDSLPYVDSDDIVIIRAYGISASGNQVEIEAHLQKPVATTPVTLPPDPSSGPGAAMMCGTATDISTKGSALINGHDFAVPSLPCSGTGCGGTDLGGGGYAVVGQGNVNTSGSGFVSNMSGAVDDNVSDTNCDEWKTLRDSLASLDTSHPDVVLLNGSGTSAALNDCSDPKVFIINTAATTYSFSGSAELCGVVVVASETAISATGNTTIIGSVMVMGENSDLSFVASSGTPRIFGNVIVESISVDKSKELEVKGTADINYSTEGLGYAQQAINDALSAPGGGGGSGLITMAWKETY